MAEINDILRRVSRETFSSLHVRNYRLYYIGQIISTSGTFMQSLAQAWLVLKLTNSGAALGIVSALNFVPVLLFGSVGGLAADRFPKRTILYFTQSTAGILALVLGMLTATNHVTIGWVYAMALCLGFVNLFDNPTRQSFVMEMVGPDNVRNAVTLYSSLVNLARVIGPSIAGALIAVVGIAPCFIINGISYAAVVIMLAAMRASELQPAPRIPYERGQIREGFRYVLSNRVVGMTLLMITIIGTLTFEFSVSLPLMAQFTFNGNAAAYALLTASMGLGAAFGGLIVAGLKNTSARQLVFAAALFGGTVLVTAAMPTLALASAALIAVGAASIYFSSLGNSILQLSSTPHMRGRVMSFWSIAFLGSTTFGGPIIGWFGQAAGPRWALALGGVAALVAVAIGIFFIRAYELD